MGKTGDAIKAAAAVAVAAVPLLGDPVHECRVDAALCPALAREQDHSREPTLETAVAERTAAGGGGNTYRATTGITVTVIEP